MKRSEALRQLSRGHHRALETALSLKRADQAGAAEAASSFMKFWKIHGQSHFRLEEEVLLPEAASRIPSTDPRMVRVLTDHVEIRRFVRALDGEERSSSESLNELGELLDSHVRHEERVLFPLIEAEFSQQELDRLSALMKTWMPERP